MDRVDDADDDGSNWRIDLPGRTMMGDGCDGLIKPPIFFSSFLRFFMIFMFLMSDLVEYVKFPGPFYQNTLKKTVFFSTILGPFFTPELVNISVDPVNRSQIPI